eukprot:260829_1
MGGSFLVSIFTRWEFLSGLVACCGVLLVPMNIRIPVWILCAVVWMVVSVFVYVDSNKRHKSEPSTNVSSRVRGYESERASKNVTDETLPLIARLRGCDFQKFTTGFTKPFDDRIHSSIARAAADTLERFGARSAFVYSDQIILVFAPRARAVRQSGDRLGSMLASYTVTRFLYHIEWALSPNDATDAQPACPDDATDALPACPDDTTDAQLACLDDPKVYFSCRTFSVPSEQEALSVFVVAAQEDCPNEALRTLARMHLKPKARKRFNSQKLREMLANKYNVDFSALSPKFLHGQFVKLYKDAELRAAQSETPQNVEKQVKTPKSSVSAKQNGDQKEPKLTNSPKTSNNPEETIITDEELFISNAREVKKTEKNTIFTSRRDISICAADIDFLFREAWC